MQVSKINCPKVHFLAKAESQRYFGIQKNTQSAGFCEKRKSLVPERFIKHQRIIVPMSQIDSIGSTLRMFTSKTPSYVILYLTAVCNARCTYCFYWEPITKANRLNELKLEEIEKISKNFGKITYLTLTGGEPFLRPDIVEIVKTFVKNNEVDFLSIPTNGGLPKLQLPKIEEMLKSCPNTHFLIPLSIDGIGKEHDTIRKLEGLFDRLMETYAGLVILRNKYGNLNVEVTSVYSKYTEEKIFEILEYVKNNMDLDTYALNLVRGDVKEPIIKDIDVDAYEKAVRTVEELATRTKIQKKDFRLKLLKAVKLVMRDVILETLREKKMVLPCVAGKRFVIINERGEVYPCDIFINHKDKMLGSLREHNYDVKEVLKTADAQKIIKWIKDTECHCTFECGIQNNIVFNPLSYGKVLKKLAKLG